VPYGGGSLTASVGSVVKHINQSIDIFVCEIETAAPLNAAFNAGEAVEVSFTESWVDGIGSSSVLPEMWPLVKDVIDGAIVVTLKETASALKLLMEKNHIICEGASATTLAAALWHVTDLLMDNKAGRRRENKEKPFKVVAILSGAGIDNETVIKCLNETL
jgi:threonine dehydratase